MKTGNGNVDAVDLSQFEFRAKNRCCNGSAIRSTLEFMYDIFSIVISILDVITDIIVLVEYYIEDKMAFFYASLAVLILAQLAYTMAFWWKFVNSFRSAGSALMYCCCLLPFAPILSFAFFFTSNKEKRVYQFLGMNIYHIERQ